MMVLVTACASLPEDFEKQPSHAYTDTDATSLGRARAGERAANPDKAGAYLLDNGLDAYVARVALAEAAERSLDVQYYLFHADLTGYMLAHQLVKAAERGVRVRLLVDDMDMSGRDFSMSKIDAHPNIEIRIFNPFARNVGRAGQFVSRLGSVTRRMHNKAYIADNQRAILGGRNIGNEYFEADPDVAFGDLDIFLMGPVVDEVSQSFDAYWNHQLAYPLSVLSKKQPDEAEVEAGLATLADFVEAQADTPYGRALKNSAVYQNILKQQLPLYWGKASAVYDDPDKIINSRDVVEKNLAVALVPFMAAVNQELLIFSPYFVPGKDGVAWLTGLVGKGVRVRILTNSLSSNDVPIVHSGYMKYRKDLIRGGVELYEVNKTVVGDKRQAPKEVSGSSSASLHAKSFVFDRQRIFVGSLNLDPRSVVENTEIGVVLDSPEAARHMLEEFDAEIGRAAFRVKFADAENQRGDLIWVGEENGQPVRYTKEPHTSTWQRLGVGIMRILPIESQL